DLIPDQDEALQWMKQDLRDMEGVFPRFDFYLTKGEHTLTFESHRGDMLIDSLKLYRHQAPISYEEYQKANAGKPNNVPEDFLRRMEAEAPFLKSDASLYPVFDRSSPLTSPSEKSKLKLNTIGGMNWARPYQELVYEFTPEADGYYKIGFKARQNILLGMFTSRTLRINGEAPFAEAEDMAFKYSNNWYVLCPGEEEGEPYQFYFEKGKSYQISLSVTLGGAGQTISTINEAVYILNTVYRRIIMVMGSTRDPFRDYELDKEINGLLGTFNMAADLLEEETARLETLTGHVGGEAQVIRRTSEQLRFFIEDCDRLPTRVSNFKTNIEALGGWAQRLGEQPLELDYIEIAAADGDFAPIKPSFWQNLTYHTQLFFASFFENFDMFEEVEEGDNSITVWIAGGSRDVAQIVQSLIESDFNKKHDNIHVKLELVKANLTMAVAANRGPDLELQLGRGLPVNMALRGGMLPLEDLEGFDEVRKWFRPDALIPYTLGDSVYALPVTQSYFMMFYRTDILEGLGIEPPQTWDELQEIIPTLQRNNMQVGLPLDPSDGIEIGVGSSIGEKNIFATLIMQRGGDIYTPDHTRTRLDEAVAREAFVEWTEYHTKYGFEQFFNAYNRFRTGEMPIFIGDYGNFNQMAATAPEIRGLWKMIPIPGTLKDDGTIDRSTGASGMASGLLKGCKNKEAAWEFLKWWLSPDVQGQYGFRMENLLGVAARYKPAAIDAFKQIPWNSEDRALLEEQWKWAKEIPEIPGSYITARNIDNAFRSVLFNGEKPREMIEKFNRIINEEITRKRNEFGLD
ncbi:MAG: extracellular solute-binding protein, partial [Clostridia bacterium]|nr:extracellular solute-binding protein [Clostridia bacterium]